MPPKKDDKKKAQQQAQGPAIITITDDELAEAQTLPQLNDFVFTNLHAFKMCRNQVRLTESVIKLYSYTNPEDPAYSEELAKKYKTVDYKQLVGLALARGLMTEADLPEFHASEPARRRQILARATKETVTALQLPLMRQKRDANAAATNAATNTDSKEELGSKEAEPQVTEQYIYLKDFPQTPEDFEELIKVGFTRMDAVNLIEETWNREIEDDHDDTEPTEEDELRRPETSNLLHATSALATAQADSSKTPAPEKLLNRMKERVRVFESCILINRLLKTQPLDSQLRNCLV